MTTVLQGVDVSNYQGPSVDWAAVAKSGISFAICKRTEGMDYVDPTFDRNYAAARTAGLVPGSYHFAHPANDPAKEAAFFLSHLPALQPGDLVALDLEIGTGNLSAWALVWLETVERALGFPPLFYSYPAFIAQSINDPALAKYPLWLADYSAGGLANCGPWPVVALRQYGSTAHVAGIPGNVDGDELARDLAGLKALGKPAPTSSVWKVSISGAVKREASHTSQAAIGPDHQPVKSLAVGTVVNLQGAPVHTDDWWQAIKVPNTGIHGYYLGANLSKA